MARLVWTEPALSDLEEIAEYIALENSNAARLLVQQVFTVVDRLQQYPASGKVPTDLGNNRYREVVCGPCRILYRHFDDEVVILYVMRSERELRHFLLEGRGDGDS